MNTKLNKFTCIECNEELPINMASADGETCKNCAEEWAEILEADTPITVRGRTDYEKFIFSGIILDPARWQAWQLSY